MKIYTQFRAQLTQAGAKPRGGVAAGRRQEDPQMALRVEASLSGTKVSTPEPVRETAQERPGSLFGTSSVSLEDLAALYGGSLEELRQNGLPAEVDLEALDRSFAELSGLDFTKTATDVGKVIEELASRYAAAKRQIGANTAGGESDGSLRALDELMNRHAEKLADSFARSVGEFFESRGMEGEKEKMRDAVRANLTGLCEGYERFLAGGDGYATIPEGEEWLRNSNVYMASELRSAFAAGGSYTAESAYTVQDLMGAASLAKAGRKILESETAGPVSEEELGLRLGTMALKAMAAADAAGGAQRHLDVFMSAVGARMDALLDESDRRLAEKRHGGGSGAYPPLDRETVASLVETILGTYRTTGDAAQALKEGIARGCRLYGEKRNPAGAAERYRRSAYMDGMFRSLSGGYAAKSTAERILEGCRAVLPGKVSLEDLFGTALRGRA